MKKLYLITLVLTTSTALSSVSSRVLADDFYIASTPSSKSTSSSSKTPSTFPEDKDKTTKGKDGVGLALILGSVGTIGVISSTIFLRFYYLKQNKIINKLKKDTSNELEKQKYSINELKTQSQRDINLNSGHISQLEKELREIKELVSRISQQLQVSNTSINTDLRQQKQELSAINEWLSILSQQQTPLDNVQVNSHLPDPKPIAEPPISSSVINEIVLPFNQNNRDYFNDRSRFQALVLTNASKEGRSGLGGHPIIQLEMTSDTSQSAYLKTEIDSENWLIPNASSAYFSHILRNLEQYPEIFEIIPGSGEMTLKRPAKLKSVGSGLWEIETPGLFSKQE